MHNTKIMQIVWGAIKGHKLRSFATLLAIVLYIVLQVLPPLVLSNAVDSLTVSKPVTALLAAEYFALIACSGLAGAWQEGMIVATGENITHALRTAMMKKLRRLPASYFTDHESGQTTSLHVNDVDAIEEMFSFGIISMFADLGTVISVLVAVFTKSVGLGVLLMVVLPFLYWFTRHIQKRMLVAHTANRAATAQASGILPETLHIIRSLHVYHSERFSERKYDDAVQKSFKAIERTNHYDAIYSPVIITVSAIVIGVMMSLSGQSGAFRSWFGMSVGTAVALISYVNSIFTPLSSIGMEIQTVQSAAAGWKRVQNYLNEEEMPAAEQKQQTGDEDWSNMDFTASAAIDVQDVRFSYDETHPVLDHFSLTVNPGEFVTLTGRTGAGKSTLFKLLLGLYEPCSGEIRIAGKKPQEYTEDERRSTMCCVEQKLTVVPGSIRDQVTLGDNKFSDEQVWKALETAGLKNSVSALPQQLDTPYDDSLFSQGQKQLVMISRAIVSDPQILLLDEITAGLDSATEKLVTAALQKASANRAVLSISHRLSEVMTGRIVELKA